MSQSKVNKGKNQKGGRIDVNLWAQDQSPPSSYKIQLGYIEVPKTIKFDEKWVDTPYRFKSFHDANNEADRIFDGYTYRIIGSNDDPHWEAPSYLYQNRNISDNIKDQRWYEVVGIKPIEENPYARYSPLGKAAQLNPEKQYALSQLSKLKTPVEAKRQMILKKESQSSDKKKDN